MKGRNDMGLQFRKRIKICKGVNLNISKTGVGVSVGAKGARYSMHSSGRRTATVGIPGTGLYYTKNLGNSKKKTSTKKGASAKKSTKEIEAQQAQAEQQLQAAQEELEQFERYIEVITNVHRNCDLAMNWQVIANREETGTSGGKGPRELKAQQEYDNYRPTLAEQIMKKLEQERRQELLAAIEEPRRLDAEECGGMNASKEFAKRMLAGDIEAYYEAIENSDMLTELADLGSDFEFGTDDPTCMEIEFTIKAAEVIPEKQLTLTKAGKLSEKDFTKTAYFDILQDYVCSCSIRLARELFAVLPVDTVVVHATDIMLDTATGHDEEMTILSVEFDRNRFLDINFDRIDASDFVSSFPHNMKFAKTTGFKPVERIGE